MSTQHETNLAFITSKGFDTSSPESAVDAVDKWLEHARYTALWCVR